jgi:hypothetical protein
MRDIYDMMDELGREMSRLRRNYPELFPTRQLTLDGGKVTIKDLAEAFVKMGDAFAEVSVSVAGAGLAGQELSLAFAREQARLKQASWLERAKSWLWRWK